VSARINPFYHFDGHGKPEYVVLVRKGAQNGIVACLGNPPKPVVLGAGSQFHGMKDLNFDAWYVYPKTTVGQGVGEGPPPRLIGEAVGIEWEERASALLYWNGTRFVWYQQGD